MRRLVLSLIAPVVVAACAPAHEAAHSATAPVASADTLAIQFSFQSCGRVTLGAPSAVCLDFNGALILSDASPPRLASYDAASGTCTEFQPPADRPAFRPSDVAVRGFFVYAVDEADRLLLRWDSSGAYRDVLLSFEDLPDRRRISPCGLAVDPSGRVAVTDIENHQVVVFDSYLHLDVAFGNYGSFPGQLNAPQGVSFTPDGRILVADTGNARLQIFSDTGSPVRVIPPEGSPDPMRRPRRAVASADGRFFVADPVVHRVFEFAADGSLVRALVPPGAGRFEPTDVALGKGGILYVTDSGRKAVHAFKVM
jgi:SMP-30/Gluconolactonase/LRE-like region